MYRLGPAAAAPAAAPRAAAAPSHVAEEQRLLSRKGILQVRARSLRNSAAHL
jgi:hypothetical protein